MGATTLDEYRKHVEKDPALERRFQPVMVREPSVEDTIAILRGLKERYEKHHDIKIKDAALEAAATLSERYITDRFLPDKAIDLVDEAASRISMELHSVPAEIDTVQRRLTRLELAARQLAEEEEEHAEKERIEIQQETDELKKKLAEPQGTVGNRETRAGRCERGSPGTGKHRTRIRTTRSDHSREAGFGTGRRRRRLPATFRDAEKTRSTSPAT